MITLIRALWKRYPDWRLGQLVYNAHLVAAEPGESLSQAEDDVLARGLKLLIGPRGPSGGGGERILKAA